MIARREGQRPRVRRVGFKSSWLAFGIFANPGSAIDTTGPSQTPPNIRLLDVYQRGSRLMAKVGGEHFAKLLVFPDIERTRSVNGRGFEETTDVSRIPYLMSRLLGFEHPGSFTVNKHDEH